MDFVVPAAWRKLIYPRRGGVPGPALSADAARGEALIRDAKSTIEARLRNSGSDPVLVAATEAYLADPATGSPAGAGAVAALVACDVGWDRVDQLSKVADAWVATRGAVFAAEAAVHAAGLDLGGNGTRMTRSTDAGWGYFPHWVALAGRVRAWLAAASDEVYEAAIVALEPLRADSVQRRSATSFLVPTHRPWVDADCAELAGRADQYVGRLLWCSAATIEQVTPFARGWSTARDTPAVLTAVEGVGPAMAPLLLGWFDTGHLEAEVQQRILGIVAHFPTDEALAGLIARLDRKYVPLATLEAARRFPQRAMRLLAEADGPAAGDLLRAHVLANRELATAQLGTAELASLTPAARARVEAALAEFTSVPVAPPEALPAVLVTPPWQEKRKATKPIVVTGLEFVAEPILAWAPGEQEVWAAGGVRTAGWWNLGGSVEVAAERYRLGQLPAHLQVTLMATGPRELVEPLLPGWRPERVWDADQWIPEIAARYGLAALPVTLHVAGARPASLSKLLLPFASAEIAEHMADALVRLKSLRLTAMAWLERHAAYAAGALIPPALGKAGPARRAAEESLRIIAIRHRDEVLAAAAGYGSPARAGIEALLGADPLQMVPARIPELPAWAEPGLLPRILLADRSSALDEQAVRHLCTMLAISKPADVYAGLPVVRDALDRRSLAEFGWALFGQWQAVGAPSKEAWPLHALRWIGNDETVRRLSPVIRAWPGEGGHAKALIGLDVLADLGTDLALTHLHGIAQKARFKGLKDRAVEKVAEVADGLGLTAEQLADRLVPDLGLDATGSLSLDYGPRRFVVGFDEQLKPYVVDEAGTRRKDLPRPGARDDQELAPAAYQRFGELKKDVRTIAGDQIHRLETAMVRQRRWPAADFRDYFVGHPLLWHIVRRLVWTATVGDGDPVAFRVAEDRTYADVADGSFDLPAEATVGLAHPVRLGPQQVAAWSQVFGDYEILQPFPQLGRPVHELTEAERAATELTRFADLKVPTTTLLGLERRGWRRGEPQDAGIQGWMWLATPDRRAVVLDLDPGIPIGALDIFPDQQISSIWVNDGPFGTWRPQRLTRTFGELDAVDASEMLRDLTEVLTR